MFVSSWSMFNTRLLPWSLDSGLLTKVRAASLSGWGRGTNGVGEKRGDPRFSGVLGVSDEPQDGGMAGMPSAQS